jgi:hypothetical protein
MPMASRLNRSVTVQVQPQDDNPGPQPRAGEIPLGRKARQPEAAAQALPSNLKETFTLAR